MHVLQDRTYNRHMGKQDEKLNGQFKPNRVELIIRFSRFRAIFNELLNFLKLSLIPCFKTR